MDDLSQERLRRLAEWRSEGGIISVYLEIDPADRRGGWRIELQDSLKEIVKAAPGGSERIAMEAAARRILDRFPQNAPHPSGRVQIGFVEVAGNEREIWHGFQTRLDRSRVFHGQAPRLTPLIRILDRGAPVGVVLTALERARAFEWSLGRIAELGAWELEIFSLDWRERKAQERGPQVGGSGTTAAGRDQYAQRLESNRARFLKELGHLLAERFGDRGWRGFLIFGEGELPRLLGEGLRPRGKLAWEVHHDLIRATDAEIEQRVEAEITALNEERERELLDRVEEAIGTDRGAALGPIEVLQALEEGRASHVIFDADHDFEPQDGQPTSELMVAHGLSTGAAITPIDGELAERLAPRGGAAALLRY
jgi:hypothetical protein